MKMLDQIKIQLALKRYTYEQLISLNNFVQKELKKRRNSIKELNK